MTNLTMSNIEEAINLVKNIKLPREIIVVELHLGDLILKVEDNEGKEYILVERINWLRLEHEIFYKLGEYQQGEFPRYNDYIGIPIREDTEFGRKLLMDALKKMAGGSVE